MRLPLLLLLLAALALAAMTPAAALSNASSALLHPVDVPFSLASAASNSTTPMDLWTTLQTMASATSSSGACVPFVFNTTTNTSQALWGWSGWYVLACLVILFFVLFLDLVPIEMAMIACTLMICVAQIITVTDMTAGFANAGILAVVCLFVVAEGLTATGAIDYFLGKLLGYPKTLGQALVRMMLPCAFVAAWISSTAVVALMIPIVQRWAKRINQPPSMLMMPMCYAVHLGGTVTLVGTTTNLVISGLYNQYYCRTMGIFELSTVGLPVAIAGLGALLLLSPKTLPDAAEYELRTTRAYVVDNRPSCWARCFRRCCRRQAVVQDTVPTYNSDFTFDALVPDSFAGKTIADTHLRHLGDLYLTTVQRGGGEDEDVQVFHAVGPEFILAAGDRVSFAGQADDFLAFCKEHELTPVLEGQVDDEEEFGPASSSSYRRNTSSSIKGERVVPSGSGGGATPTPPPPPQQPAAAAAEEEEEEERAPAAKAGGAASVAAESLNSFTLQAVVRAGSELEGKTMKEVNFRSTYLASVLAIHRAGERVNPPGSKLGQVKLKVGDALLLLVSDDFSWDAYETTRDLKPRLSSSTRPSSFALSAAASPSSPTSRGGEVLQEEEISDYIFSMRVAAKRRLLGVRLLAGLTLDQAGLRTIPGLTVVAVTRGEGINRAVGPEFVLEAGDVVWFSGSKDGLPALRRVPGLEDTDLEQLQRLDVGAKHRRLVEVVLSLNSDLLYKTVRENRFRTRFHAAIVAVQRRNHRVLAKIGDIELEPGDVLILEAGPDFALRFARDQNFLIISEVEHSAPPRMDRFYIAVFAALSMIICTAATGMDLLIFALFAAGIILAFGVLTRERAHKAIDWKIIITVAAAFGLSTAMTNTKVASVIGFAITELAVSTGTGQMGVFAVVMIFTEILCALITAKAGALLMFPIAANAAYRLDINPTTMAIALMLGSSDYTTPQGHQTNLMVMGPGAYRFVDYTKLGIPLEIYLNIVQLLCLGLVQFWYINTVVAIFILAVCVLIDHRFVSKLPVSDWWVWLCACCRGGCGWLRSTCSSNCRCRRRRRHRGGGGGGGARHEHANGDAEQQQASSSYASTTEEGTRRGASGGGGNTPGQQQQQQDEDILPSETPSIMHQPSRESLLLPSPSHVDLI